MTESREGLIVGQAKVGGFNISARWIGRKEGMFSNQPSQHHYRIQVSRNWDGLKYDRSFSIHFDYWKDHLSGKKDVINALRLYLSDSLKGSNSFSDHCKLYVSSKEQRVTEFKLHKQNKRKLRMLRKNFGLSVPAIKQLSYMCIVEVYNMAKQERQENAENRINQGAVLDILQRKRS